MSNHLFDSQTYAMFHKPLPRITRWERFLLWFCRAYFISDPGSDNYLIVKRLFGKTYIVGERPPQLEQY